MGTTKFRARFKRKLTDGRDYEVKDILVPYSSLKEGEKLKPPNTFRWQKGSYIFDAEMIGHDYDKMGNPIIQYYVGNSLPIPPVNGQIPIIKDSDGTYIEVNADVLDKTFIRGEMKSVIASSQKEAKQWDWQTLLIGALMGAAVGMMIMSIIYPDVFKGTTLRMIGVLRHVSTRL